MKGSGALRRRGVEEAPPEAAENGSHDAPAAPLSVVERVVVRDSWNKFLPFDEMLIEMFFERLLLDAPDLAEQFGPAVDQAPAEFLALIDRAARALEPGAERGLREAYREAPGAAAARCRTTEEAGAFFAAYGMSAEHWRIAQRVFVWVFGKVPYMEDFERDPELGVPHILVVEDNATNQFVLSLFLKRLGYTFDVAQHGAEALIAWERRPYDLILMDVEMPVLDGFEATRELRRREQAQDRPHTPIIALSADAMLENRDMAKLVGMDDFVTKPIELDRLERLVRNHVGARASLA